MQRNDIAMAITKYDQFDFLIDIVPREEVKPARVKEEGRGALCGVPTDQVRTIIIGKTHAFNSIMKT